MTFGGTFRTSLSSTNALSVPIRQTISLRMSQLTQWHRVIESLGKILLARVAIQFVTFAICTNGLLKFLLPLGIGRRLQLVTQ